MSYKIAIIGPPNSGKSYSRRTIKDGENVIILQPSVKAAHLKTSAGDPVGNFNVQTAKYKTLEDARVGMNLPSIHHVIKVWNDKLEPGKIKKESVKGSVQLIKDIDDIPIWMEFISKHLPWIHTVIFADFTHYISEVISRKDFIDRKMGGEAYQRFWELAGQTLRSFILSIDKYRNDLIVVTEYHADFNEVQGCYEIYTPAGKMLTEKFKPESYYDVFLFSHVDMSDDDEKYQFVVRRTKQYPFARSMQIFGDARYIDNDLQLVLDSVRKYLGGALDK